jgi:hypothetical protein
LFKEVPCLAGFINDVVVVVEDGDREFVAAQIFPDVFNRIEFRSVGRQTYEGDVFGDRERGSNVIVCTENLNPDIVMMKPAKDGV